ncbi:expressed unknown protein [Seminavis robusta]|uniref:Uncharacterized protein n=1 Tax=Seminavis robusta TaxID=568900 RepID=A0A9N8E849_9STRA|nr:expressed unknown protein [Seminavis robusta]|eukprot:Sro652_g181800.1 n/a (201) ;mRNA; f:27762-28498
MRPASAVLLLVLCLAAHPTRVHAGEFLNTIFLILTFGIGGIVNNCIARPKCQDGVAKLGLEYNDFCGCIADIESGPLFCVRGVGGCNSGGVFCIEGDLCGDSTFDMTFGDGGKLKDDLYGYFFATTPDVYELRVIATPLSNKEVFESCSAAVEGKECGSCNICPDGISFRFDCSDITVGSSGAAGPVMNDCLNFLFQKVV